MTVPSLCELCVRALGHHLVKYAGATALIRYANGDNIFCSSTVCSKGLLKVQIIRWESLVGAEEFVEIIDTKGTLLSLTLPNVFHWVVSDLHIFICVYTG